nr:MAG TPA: hypothetical protein [Caudoviricetes sp.]
MYMAINGNGGGAYHPLSSTMHNAGRGWLPCR